MYVCVYVCSSYFLSFRYSNRAGINTVIRKGEEDQAQHGGGGGPVEQRARVRRGRRASGH